MKFIIFFLLFASAPGPVLAGTAVISGRLDFLHDGDSLVIKTSKYGDPWFIGFQRRYACPIKNHSFRVELPVEGLFLKIESIQYSVNDRDGHLASVWIESGDDVFISQKNGAWSFSGPGAGSWDVAQQLDAIYSRNTKRVAWGTAEGFQSYLEATDSAVTQELAFIEAHKLTLGRNIYALLKANIVGLQYGKTGFLKAMDSTRRVQAVENAGRWLDVGGKIPAYNLSARDGVFLYADRLAAGLGIRYYTDSVTLPGRPFNAIACYHYILAHYTGFLKERLAVDMLYNARTGEQDISGCIANALGWVENRDYRDILHSMQEDRVHGSHAYNFRLPGMDGKIHRLQDYNGKVVLLDFYYNGCGSCRKAHVYIDSIQKLFTGKDFLVVSISADRDRGWWEAGVKSGKYTSEKSPCLFTEGEGEDHPVFRHYLVSAYPTLVLVDKKGRQMLNPVDPLEDKGASLSALIRKGLSE